MTRDELGKSIDVASETVDLGVYLARKAQILAEFDRLTAEVEALRQWKSLAEVENDQLRQQRDVLYKRLEKLGDRPK